jgi:2-polyprenyl-6-hydroxyphenyl methylase/3-demethylubiquinone-9 3-methyltransferase
LLGEVDFNKSCEDRRQVALPRSGLSIPYHRCGDCGFAFTVAFDGFTAADFHAHIYNEEYVSVDPDFVEVRPRHNAELVSQRILAGSAERSVLDYGGGNGLMSRLLRDRGITRAQSYDPFYAGSARPSTRFDLVTCFEVMEHTTTPYETMRDLRWFMQDRGMIVFSTLLQPASFASEGLAWWYASPRNGHVSLYSRESLNALTKRLGVSWASFNDVLHVAYRKKLPQWAAHLVG